MNPVFDFAGHWPQYALMAETPQRSDLQTPPHSAFANAVCLDLPYIVDSVWRRAEFNLNRMVQYDIDPSRLSGVRGTISRRPYGQVLPFWFFLFTLVFVSYGPTFDAWCSVVGARGMLYSRALLGIACITASLLLWCVLIVYGELRARKRFLKAQLADDEVWRRFCVRVGVQVAVVSVVSALFQFGLFLYRSRLASVCRPLPLSSAPARYQAILLAAVIVLAFVLARRSIKTGRRLQQQVVLLLGMALLLWFGITPRWASEANQSPYLHTYGVFACALAVLACASRPFARWQFGTVSERQRLAYRAALSTTELFPGSRVDPHFATRTVVAALATGVFYHALEFLLLPSFFALMVPSRFLAWTFIVVCGAAAWLLMTGNFTTRWQAMVQQVRRWFLLGTPLAVSVGVIALALLRLLKVQYVATVLDAAPFGVIFVWIIMAYVLLWWFEFAINRAVAAELLAIVGSDEDVVNGYLNYLPDQVPANQLQVQLTGRYIVAHGSGRFAVLGWFVDQHSNEAELAFETFDLIQLFGRLTPAGLDDLWHDLKRRIELYFVVVNIAVCAVLVAGCIYYGYGDRHNTVAAVVEVSMHPPLQEAAAAPDLADLLRGRSRPTFIVAASGGGTRAALFTATALEGLNNLGVTGDIVLLSGVSGGGVAEAYFYTHRDALMGSQRPLEWNRFKDRMTEPFIADVLEGAGEWRLMSRQPLGQLLVESFERRLFATPAGQATMGMNEHVGLILNSTIAAHPQEDSDLLRAAFLPRDTEALSCDAQHMPYALMGGGRLIFTNLAGRDAFPPSGELPSTDGKPHLPDVRLPYVVVQDHGVSIARAAALNANFPPVFTNARVNVPSETADTICPQRAYYVTDGGATENLGLVSALYALRAALAKLQPAEIPEIHIVTVEASATTYDYMPDRGVNAATGGSKERLTGGLSQELLNEVQELASHASGGPRHSRVQVHALALPLAFRSRGGFGTHWMFPDVVVVENPQLAVPLTWYEHQLAAWFSKSPPDATMDKHELIDLWTALYRHDHSFCRQAWTSTDQRQVANWVCGKDSAGVQRLEPDLQIGEWAQLIESLGIYSAR